MSRGYATLAQRNQFKERMEKAEQEKQQLSERYGQLVADLLERQQGHSEGCFCDLCEVTRKHVPSL